MQQNSYFYPPPKKLLASAYATVRVRSFQNSRCRRTLMYAKGKNFASIEQNVSRRCDVITEIAYHKFYSKTAIPPL